MKIRLDILASILLTAVLTFSVTKAIYDKPAPADPSVFTGAVQADTVEGSPDTVYLPAKKVIGAAVLKPHVSDPRIKNQFYNRAISFGEGESVQIQVETYPPTDSVVLNYIFNLQPREVSRVDTVRVSRVDTIRVPIPYEIEQPFYLKPKVVLAAGVIIGGALTFLLMR